MMSWFNHDLRFRNKYRIEGNVAVIEIVKRSGEKLETTISAHQLPRVITRYPSIFIVDRGYVGGYIRGTRKRELLHRFLTNAPKNKFVDHIDGNPLNNQDDNLRLVTNAENQQNRRSAQSNNESTGIWGVTWYKNTKSWRARVRKGKLFIQQYYKDIYEAVEFVRTVKKLLHPYSDYEPPTNQQIKELIARYQPEKLKNGR
ncbi:HNH endonuclease [Aquibacillus sp. 3ASR75-11]|uniref:HNH endonuclease n=1 Tax=Terrihalobacillus insolitus TaxID=2950438 RepID=A0A9X3WZQ9_9BACI|nr:MULTISPECIES: HNH endonuclease [Bacillaceae]KKB35144.1 Phage-associated homing endonuclease [Bacillus thermotolerans]MDC3426329.1 HNH endonuclease [Terrihalobacillus insolitus]